MIVSPDGSAEKARAMITADPGPTLEMTSTWDGGPALRIVAASAGRGKPREKYTIIGPTWSEIFRMLSELVIPD